MTPRGKTEGQQDLKPCAEEEEQPPTEQGEQEQISPEEPEHMATEQTEEPEPLKTSRKTGLRHWENKQNKKKCPQN